jgi:DNA-binding CsgD family transcriptional regulator
MTTLLNHLHWLTLVFIAFESIFFLIQVWDIYKHPHEHRQWWYLVLLFLLLAFNLGNGLFPDPDAPVPEKLQYILADGLAYLLGAYFPLYFYKAFELDRLRFHALKGVPLFVVGPYLAFLAGYLFNNQLLADREYSVLLPAVYGAMLLFIILKTIQRKHADDAEWPHYREALAVWLAILPWEAMSGFAFFTAIPQWLKILPANFGWLVVTFFMMVRAARDHQARHWHYQELTREVSREEYDTACRALPISEREMDVALLFWEELTSAQIAERLFIEQGTVQTHINHILKKTGCKDRKELLARLLTPPSSPGKP